MDDAIRIAERWYVLASSSRADDRTRVLKHGETFAVFDRFGDVQLIGTGEHGIYHQGSRYLSHLELRLNGERPMLLNSSVKQDNFLLTVHLTTTDFCEEGKITVLKGTVHVARARLLWMAACHELLIISNYGEQPVTLNVSLHYGADYADIFEARGFSREGRGEYLPPEVHDGQVLLGYRGLEGLVRRTGISFVPAASRLTAEKAEFDIELPPRGTNEIALTITCEPGVQRHGPVVHANAVASADTAVRNARGAWCSVTTANEQLNDWLQRSAADLVMLVLDNPEGPYPYAGVPWYSTPFGRDGLITAMHCLWIDPGMARSVLAYLAETQATEERAEQDAEPGKILHEARKGELAAIGAIPFGRYYGTADATPLFIALAGQYFRRTGDLEFVRQIWGNVERALQWLSRYGDPDGDGFYEYRRKTDRGLVHQGWKDSDNSVFHRDGRPAEGPIALCEVQAYVYAAKLEAAELSDALGEPLRAGRLRREAFDLQEQFEQAFWCEEIGSYAIALDGAKEPCAVRTSNAGHVLWSGIASFEHAERTAQTLLAPESFSGWGVRTVAEGEPCYNPMSYHNGSIWPHDNAMVAMGLSRYDLKEGAMRILTALFDASQYMDLHRLPELYCGFPRWPSEGPTLYPVACSPQAWASSSVFYLLQACLGMSLHFRPPHVRFEYPLLPACIERMEIRNLKAGNGVVDLALYRHERDVGVNVLRKSGDVEVSVIV
ncbi:MAG: amylo-alpha-1,6-glucosidase [Betaproteobacteria bacterium RIFCSPLOWO2_12_FULL_66_14]|nr:MAG: amylo-alpha-1,6-glucosidase [Betaproteobacteria bacterium RIFCSPLOWO2_12_FULL_66_14]